MAKKKKHSKHKKSLKPDQVEYFGPFGMARYGKFTIMRNFLSADQHNEFMRRAAENYSKICTDIDLKIKNICLLVRDFHPLQLLKYGYELFASRSIGKIAEVDLDSDVAVALRMVDYIQSIIVSIPKSDKKITDQIDEEKWKELHREVEQLYYFINTSYHISRTAYAKLNDDNYDEKYNDFYVKAQMLWANVRGCRYSIHDIPHHRSLLLLHNDIFLELFGVSIDEFIEGIKRLQDSLLTGIPSAFLELKEFQKKIMNIVEKRIAEAITTEDLTQLTHQVIEEQGWQDWQNSIMGRIVQFDLYDVQKVTGLPENLLRELSWAPGEYQELFSPGEFVGWPLRLLSVHVRPFIYVEGKYYCFELFSLMDNLYRVIQRMITRLRPDYKEKWNKKQKEVSENLPFELFAKLLPGARIYRSIFHLWSTEKSGKKNWCETDGVIIFDDHLIVVEIKAGAFTYTPPATDFPAYIDSIKNLLLKPAMQARRFIDYLNSSEDVNIYDENKELITNLRHQNFRLITSCCVTIDNFTTLASQAENLKPIGADLQDFPIWSVSVDDLRVYVEIFDSPLIFAHFLEERKRAFESPALRVNDELEHLSLYLKHNRYVTYAFDFYDENPVGWHGYLSDLDKYFYDLMASPETASKPIQPIPRRIAEILNTLECEKNPGFCKAASCLLDMDGETRNAFDESLEEVLIRKTKKGKFIPFSMFGETRLTVFCCMEGVKCPDISWMRDYVLATLLRTKDRERMMLQLKFDCSKKVYKVDFEFLSLSEIPLSRYGEIEEISECQKKNYLESYMMVS